MSFYPDERSIPLARRRRKWVDRDISCFRQEEQVGEGTYGQVWSARDKQTNERVALKKFRMESENEGFPVTAIREIKLLKALNHDNIVALKEIVTGVEKGGFDEYGDPKPTSQSIYLVFEYMDHDLTGLMDTPGVHFREDHIKCYMQQLLSSLKYCHDMKVLHRDIKGSNLLIDNNGCLKIADLGLGRFSGEDGRRYTNRVVTLWYRPPELLLGENEYNFSIDMWSAGCIIAEMLLKKPIFQGRDEAEQQSLIFNLTGTPTNSLWPGWQQLPNARSVKGKLAPRLASYLAQPKHGITQAAADLICSLFALDPARRLTADQALDHDWFQTEPRACAKGELPKFKQSAHEWQAQRRRQEATTVAYRD